MSLPTLLLIVALACAFWNVATSIRVTAELQKRGEKVSLVWLRLMAPSYAHRLRRIMIAETGGSGSLYLQWILSINLALVLALAALAVYLLA